MRITIAARHCDVPEDLRAEARAQLARLERLAPRPHHLHLTFGAEHGRYTVELRLHTNRRQVHVGLADAADHRSALDRAVAKVRRQLDKTPVRRARATVRGGR